MSSAPAHSTPAYRRLRRRSGQHSFGRSAPTPTLARVLRIDLKRAGGPWLIPVAMLYAYLFIRDSLTPGVAVWPELTGTIAQMAMPLTIVSIAIGGLAGGRERRREIGELTVATAMTAWQRYLSVATSIFLWALAMYALVATTLLTYGTRRATWGGPEWGVILAPIPVLALAAAFGVLAGRAVRDRTAPVIAIALFVLLFAMPFAPQESTRPLNVFTLNTWFDPVVENATARPFSTLAQLAWGVGLTGVVIGIGILWERRNAVSSALLAFFVVLAFLGALSILDAGYHEPTSFAMASGRELTSPAGRICDDSGAIEVCVHPAYERLLPDVASDVNAYLGPMAGLNGVVREVYISSGNGHSGGWDTDSGRAYSQIDLRPENGLHTVIAQDLWPMSFYMDRTAGPPDDTVQYVVMTALAREIGVDEWSEWFHRVPSNADEPAVQDAINRFASLPPDDQRSWLQSNWDDLSQGTLTVDDLP